MHARLGVLLALVLCTMQCAHAVTSGAIVKTSKTALQAPESDSEAVKLPSSMEWVNSADAKALLAKVKIPAHVTLEKDADTTIPDEWVYARRPKPTEVVKLTIGVVNTQPAVMARLWSSLSIRPAHTTAKPLIWKGSTCRWARGRRTWRPSVHG